MSLFVFQVLHLLLYFVTEFISHRATQGRPISRLQTRPVGFNLGVGALQCAQWPRLQPAEQQFISSRLLHAPQLSPPLRTSSVTGRQWEEKDKEKKEGLGRWLRG